MASVIDPDEEPTQPAEPRTMAQCAEDWAVTFAEVAFDQRPTRRIRAVRKSEEG